MRERQRNTDAPPDVVPAFVRGDTDAFFEVYRLHEGAIRRVAQRVFDGPFEQEEAVQEIWLTVHRSCHTFDPARGSLSGWLRAVAINKVRELLRAKGREPAADLDLDEAPDEALKLDGPGPEKAAQLSRIRAAVTQFARGLPAEEARVLELALVEELSLEEVAQALSSTVRRCKYLKKKLLVRAVTDPGLQRVLEELLPEGGR